MRGLGVDESRYPGSHKNFAPSVSQQEIVVHLVLILLIGLLCYFNTFHSPFQWDDTLQIGENPIIRNLGNFISDWKGYDYNPRRFIGYLTFALNYYAGGLSVTGYHVVNLAIHITNAMLVYFLVLLTFRTPVMLALSESSSTSSPAVIALFAALLFVSHPVQTEAVTYIVQRFASLAALFYLLSVVTYVKGRLSGWRDKKDDNAFSSCSVLFYLTSVISAVCAMKTKEIAFTLPLVIALYEFVFFKSPIKKRLVFLLPVVLTLIIIPVSILKSGKPLGEILSDVSEKTRVQTEMSRWDYLMTETRVITTYMRLIFLPVRQNLDYDYPIYHSLFTLAVFLSFVFLVSVFLLGIYLLFVSRPRAVITPRYAPCYRLMGFGILWFFTTLSVESSLIPIVDVIFEHRVYLPSAGLFTAVAAGAFVLSDRLKKEKLTVTAAVFIIAALSGLTYERNTVWNSTPGLWQDAAEKSPNKARVHNNLGDAFFKMHQMDKALWQFQDALRLRPDYAEAHNNLGSVYYSLGLMDKAFLEYQAAIKLYFDYAVAHNNLGSIYAARGNLDEALREFTIALNLNPDYADAYYNLGNAYYLRGQLSEAVRAYEAVIRLNPDDVQAHRNLERLSGIRSHQ